MAFIAPRAGWVNGSIQSLLRRNFQFQPRISAHQGQQHRSFTDAQLYNIGKDKVQIYKSTSSDPYVNLAIENHLLQHSCPDSVILFLYKNRPCVVIGRNQNPWLEVNLSLLQEGITRPSQNPDEGAEPQKIDIVRRRSGGGTVFHDEGNVNWAVICPKSRFKRDEHAEMVVRGLETLNIKGSPRVNERHDIVLDVNGSTYKVSGSAFKLIRLRALHHGTCLLESPYLSSISGLLNSPAVAYIRSNGSDSVRSPVCNVGAGTEEFISAVVDEFKSKYDYDGGHLSESDMLVHEDSALKVKGIRNDVDELRSDRWIYGETPKFIFSTEPVQGNSYHMPPIPEDPRPRPPLPVHLPPKLSIFFLFQHGKCTTGRVSSPYHDDQEKEYGGVTKTVSEVFKPHLYRIRTWEDIVLPAGRLDEGSGTPESRAMDCRNIAMWLNELLPPVVGTANMS